MLMDVLINLIVSDFFLLVSRKMWTDFISSTFLVMTPVIEGHK